MWLYIFSGREIGPVLILPFTSTRTRNGGVYSIARSSGPLVVHPAAIVQYCLQLSLTSNKKLLDVFSNYFLLLDENPK